MKFGFKDYFLMYKKRGIRLPVSYFFQTHLFDLINGTDTHRWLPKENYIDKPKNFENGVLYMSSWTGTIKEATNKAIDIFSLNSKDITFIDIGCGKGKVLYVWKKMFLDAKRIVGIDYSYNLIKVCKNNFKKINSNNIEIICGDAIEIDLVIDSSAHLFYLYNPFNEKVLRKFLKNLKNKKVIIIYNNPVHKKIFINSGFREYFNKEGWHQNIKYKIFSNLRNV